MNLNGILIGSEDPEGLVAYYTRLFGEPGWAGGDFRGWQLGTGYVTVGPHDQVRSRNPSRVRRLRAQNRRHIGRRAASEGGRGR